jgi:hypothetical protein
MDNKKASQDALNELHSLVAKQLTMSLDDPRTLGLAIKFLKDNDITADLFESETLMSLTESIKRIASEANEDSSFSVEDMINRSH